VGEQRRGRRAKKTASDDPLESWRAAATQLADHAVMPATTTLVFVEGELTMDKTQRVTNPAFALFAPLAQVEAWEPLSGGELASWVRQSGEAKGVNLAPRAVAALSQLAGPDLWALDNDLEKLAAYASGELVDEKTIAEVVSAAQQAKVWDLTDAIVEGNARKASSALQRLLREGEPATLIAFMIARQFRQIALVKDMRMRRMRQDEIERGAGITSYRLKAVGDLAGRYSWGALRRAYALLLESDLAVKRGIQNDEAALDLLVNQLCALAPVAGRRGGYRPAAASA
jgi:DNA polymerase-3 subunit delta